MSRPNILRASVLAGALIVSTAASAPAEELSTSISGTQLAFTVATLDDGVSYHLVVVSGASGVFSSVVPPGAPSAFSLVGASHLRFDRNSEGVLTFACNEGVGGSLSSEPSGIFIADPAALVAAARAPLDGSAIDVQWAANDPTGYAIPGPDPLDVDPEEVRVEIDGTWGISRPATAIGTITTDCGTVDLADVDTATSNLFSSAEITVKVVVP